MVFLVILGRLKFVKKSPIKPVLGNVGMGSLHRVTGGEESGLGLQPRDHLQNIELDLPDPILGVPELKKL